MLAVLTGLGLSAAAGLNAYIPLLVVGLLAHFSDVVRLPAEFSWLSSGWAIAVLTLLLAAEVVLDKVPVVDHVNDVVQTVVRPASGGVVSAATSAAAALDESAWMRENPWAGWLLGIVVALTVHLVKSGTRPLVNATTGGVGAPVVSTAEDAGSLGMSLVAIFLPALVVVVLIAVAVIAVRLVLRRRRRRRRRGGSPSRD
ncbi:DUF4126 domain-containing protein [Rhizohabitans arisaemae]|uniref:DUF4126 domain-containing protein n=1 Tax=Rhizohabitans arisaemae TaxID=2720610 RepID=UPI0024B058DB|nr:DUF4126 domain-containing protein [Rhizohabitans arisaemae]